MSWKQILVRTWHKYNQDQLPRLGAALTYYTLFALFPLVLLLVVVLGVVVPPDVPSPFNVRLFVTAALAQVFPALRGSLSEAINTMAASPGQIGIAGLVALVWSASHLFAELHAIFDVIFGQRADLTGWAATVRGKALAIGLVVAVAILLFVSMLLNTLLTALGAFVALLPGGGTLWHGVGLALGLFVPAILLAGVYRFVPNCPVSNRSALIGGALTAIGWKIGQVALSWYLARNSYDALYGSIGGVVALMFWAYYVSQVLVFGATFTAVYDRRHEPLPDAEPATIAPPRRRAGRAFLGGVVAGIVVVVGGFVAAARRLTARFSG